MLIAGMFAIMRSRVAGASFGYVFRIANGLEDVQGRLPSICASGPRGQGAPRPRLQADLAAVERFREARGRVSFHAAQAQQGAEGVFHEPLPAGLRWVTIQY